MKYHILVFGETKSPRRSCRLVVQQLLRRRKWYCCELSPRWRTVEAGDTFLFYLAGKGHRVFIGNARAAGLPRLVDGREKRYLESLELDNLRYFIPLEDIEIWKETRSITPLLRELSFTRRTRHYGGAFRYGITEIEKRDFDLITGA